VSTGLVVLFAATGVLSAAVSAGCATSATRRPHSAWFALQALLLFGAASVLALLFPPDEYTPTPLGVLAWMIATGSLLSSVISVGQVNTARRHRRAGAPAYVYLPYNRRGWLWAVLALGLGALSVLVANLPATS
jgi:hypothetical protein